MNKSDIRRFQEESVAAYDRTQDVQAAANMAQVAMLAEIALQLAKLNELLTSIAKRLEEQ